MSGEKERSLNRALGLEAWRKFRALWGARTEEELRIRCAALGVDFKRFKDAWGPVWEMSND